MPYADIEKRKEVHARIYREKYEQDPAFRASERERVQAHKEANREAIRAKDRAYAKARYQKQKAAKKKAAKLQRANATDKALSHSAD